MPNQSKVTMEPLGDSGVIIRVGDKIDPNTHQLVKNTVHILEQQVFPGMVEILPAFTTVAVFYDPSLLSYVEVCSKIRSILSQPPASSPTPYNRINIPVCYDEALAPDLTYVAQYHNLTPKQVVQIHTEPEYLVYMIGFAPGFPYLGGMSQQIATPRRATPRTVIPAGSVGIAAGQTGVYPLETPGGWQIIGRTPLSLFQPHLDPPTRVQMGDHVRFYPISREEYEQWGSK